MSLTLSMNCGSGESLNASLCRLLVADRARFARPRLIMQPVEAAPGEAAPPLTDRVVVTAQLRGNLLTRKAIRSCKNDPAAIRQCLRALRAPSPPLQRLPLLPSQHDLGTSRAVGPRRQCRSSRARVRTRESGRRGPTPL